MNDLIDKIIQSARVAIPIGPGSVRQDANPAQLLLPLIRRIRLHRALGVFQGFIQQELKLAVEAAQCDAER
jgi:hypothetical protein